MKLEKLTVSHFRSYTNRSFTFTHNTTVILGQNTTGKTNILEALFLLATGKSFRAEKHPEMISWLHEMARVSGECQTHDDRVFLEVVITNGQVAGQKTPINKYLINGIGRRLVDFVGNVKTVLFWPEDLELVTDSPSIRRRYLDFVLTQVDREYRRSLMSYEKGVRQRNRLLEKIREGEAQTNQLMFWDQLLIKTGSYISDKRSHYIEQINKSQKTFGEFFLRYDASVISEARLREYAEAEVVSATTLVGPHRDDFNFLEKKRDLSKYGSRGEQRLAILWLKLSELGFVEKEMQVKPVLLLDDIFSELDHKHRDEIAKIVDLQQTIITTADKHFLPENLIRQAEMIELK